MLCKNCGCGIKGSIYQTKKGVLCPCCLKYTEIIKMENNKSNFFELYKGKETLGVSELISVENTYISR